MNNLEVIIGIEIHIELNTKTKMFSSAPNNFHAEANTNVSPVDLAYPGTLPVVNKGAVVRGIKLAKALEMDIDRTLYFDRKNYFYPDLPKGFQITQDKRPIGSEGKIVIEVDGVKKEVGIERIHLEEDTAKSSHSNNHTLLDYNRAGVPLIEIVSHPVLRSAKEAAAYINAIRMVARSLGISDAKMEEGSLRADINLSLRPYGQEEFGTKVEVKNMNSISNAEKAIAKEIAHQTKDILAGKEILQATKRFDEGKQDVITMRVKTDAADYKYYSEANIPPISLSEEFIESVTIGELPWEVKDRLEALKVSSEYINQLLVSGEKLAFFDAIDYSDKVKTSKLFFSEVVSLANSENKEVNELGINPTDIAFVLNKQEQGDISGSHIKKIIPLISKEGLSAEEIIEKYNLKQITDEAVITEMVEEIIANNQGFIESNSERPERVTKFILGNVMKVSKGQASPVVAAKLVNKLLNI